MFDAIIIGAGVVGNSLAYQLSRYQGRFLVLEKQRDLGEGTSKANSAIAHGGYDAVPGTKKAEMNALGIRMMGEIAKTLDFPFRRIGSLVLCHKEENRPAIEKLYRQGLANGTRGMEIWEHDRILKEEPEVEENVVCALYCSDAGIVDPFLMTWAFAEQAEVNGVEFRFEEVVKKIEKIRGGWRLTTAKESYETRAVVNCAGLYADELHNMVSDRKYTIKPRSGEYWLLDKETQGFCHHVLFDVPTEKGKGVLVTPTTPGNILIGPTSTFVDKKDAVATTTAGIREVHDKSGQMVRNLPYGKVITSFTGLRAHEEEGDFVLDQAEPGFYDCLGIESPGLTASPAIGKVMADKVGEDLELGKNPSFLAERKAPPDPKRMSLEEFNQLVKKEPAYGRIICRCEQVTEGEIVAAIHCPLGARSLDGLKRRVRATAGRCQGGFCTPLLIKILARELNEDPCRILKNDRGSYLLSGKR